MRKKNVLRRGRKKQRGMALFVALILIAVLTGATIALATLATADVEIAASDRRGALAFTIAEAGVDEVLGDGRLSDSADDGAGFAPDPDGDLIVDYTPSTRSDEARYTAAVKFVREGPVEESSALEVKSIVYAVSVEGEYVLPDGADGIVTARTPVNAEIYRIAPKTQGLVSRARHYE